MLTGCWRCPNIRGSPRCYLGPRESVLESEEGIARRVSAASFSWSRERMVAEWGPRPRVGPCCPFCAAVWLD